MGVLLFLTAVGSALAQQDSAAEPPSGQRPAAASSQALQEFKQDALAYAMHLQSRPDAPLKLRAEPLLHWGNPARLGEDGAVFVWMLDGRPEVIGSVFTFRQGDLIRRKHEYHSLASGPLTARFRGRRAWAPQAAGVSFRPVDDAPAPPAAERARLSQMKRMAGDFSAEMVEFNGQQSELRRLPQPLIRYAPQDQTAFDGAIFAFSSGTDPEALLLIEARRQESGAQWQFAFARYHFVDLKAFHKGREVWHVEGDRGMPGLEIGSRKYQDSIYATYQVGASPVEE